mmetsp:Transcript_11064/g.16500  ORF Transcript_11064/g.16500 Transcript_11064/m.16500 type:complete len:436 (-) Transcript_11064:62-1369(-)
MSKELISAWPSIIYPTQKTTSTPRDKFRPDIFAKDGHHDNMNSSEIETIKISGNSDTEGESSEGIIGVGFDSFEPKYEIFDSQVSGHMPLITSGCGRVGKPAIPQEVTFYEEVLGRNPDLKPFAPNYLGCLDMSLSEIEEIGADFIINNDEHDSGVEYGSDCYSREGKHEGSRKKEGTASDHRICRSGRSRRRKSLCSKESMWIKFIKRYCRELGSKWEGDLSRSVRFLLLEDLTFPFRSGRACILDVKLGTRQYRVGATAEKELRQRIKSKTTTTGQFGFRLNGMRIWNRKNNSFVIRDKYWGRSIQGETLESAIEEFFFDGESLRLDVIPPLLDLLVNLSTAIETARSNCRFYSSSVLLIYDGATHGDNFISHKPKVDVRMIDFANSLSTVSKTCLKDSSKFTNFHHPEDGCLLGIRNLVNILEGIHRKGLKS